MDENMDRSLADLAKEVLREMILDRKLSAGDLIKLLAAQEDETRPQGGRDYVIRLLREET